MSEGNAASLMDAILRGLSDMEKNPGAPTAFKANQMYERVKAFLAQPLTVFVNETESEDEQERRMCLTRILLGEAK